MSIYSTNPDFTPPAPAISDEKLRENARLAVVDSIAELRVLAREMQITDIESQESKEDK